MRFYKEKFAQIRKEKRISLTSLASEMGLNRNTLWLWETGKVIPSEKKIRFLAEKLGVTSDQISDLPDLPEVKTKEYSKIFSSWSTFADENIKEREKRQAWFLDNIKTQFSELSQALVLIKALFSATDTIFYVKDLYSKYVAANQAFLANISLNENFKVSGMFDIGFFPKRDADLNSIEDETVINSGIPVKNREGFIPGSKNRKWGIISKIPIFDSSGKIAGLVASFVDITERKKAEKLVGYLQKGLEMMEEIIFIAKKAKDDPEGGILFDDILYMSNIGNPLMRKIFKEKLDIMSVQQLFEYSKSCMFDASKRFSVEAIKKKKVLETHYKVKVPEYPEVYNLCTKLYYDPESDLYIDITREDEDVKKIEKIVANFRKYGVKEEVVRKCLE